MFIHLFSFMAAGVSINSVQFSSFVRKNNDDQRFVYTLLSYAPPHGVLRAVHLSVCPSLCVSVLFARCCTVCPRSTLRRVIPCC